MARAKPLRENVPSSHPPVKPELTPAGTCSLCGEPILPGQTVQVASERKEGGGFERIHLRCYRDRAISEAAMSRRA